LKRGINYEAIHENVDKYIEREGKPKLFRWPPKSGDFSNSIAEGYMLMLHGINKNVINKYHGWCGDGCIQRVKSNSQIYLNTNSILSSIRLNRKKEEMDEWYLSVKGKGTLKERIKNWYKYHSFTAIVNTLFLENEEKYMINWMQSQEEQDDQDHNIHIQPCLRNTYAFIEYFKQRDGLIKKLKEENSDSVLMSDEKLISKLEKIPIRLRDFDIDGYIRSVIER